MNWARDAVFYHIYPLGLCDAPQTNDTGSTPVPRLERLYRWADHMKWLGANALYLGPIFESRTHGYDTTDYLTVDRRLGTNDTLEKFIRYLHERDIRIVLDAVFNHVGRDFFAFRDLLEHGRRSRYVDWFSGVRFDARSPAGDPFTYDTWDGHYGLVKLNLGSREVRDYLFGVVDTWIDTFDIDGLRLDAANVMDRSFLQELARHCRGIRPDFWLLGEVVLGDYREWTGAGNLDSVTNYEAYKGLYSSHNDRNYFEIAHSLTRQFGKQGIYADMSLYNFADNHDVDRIASILHEAAHLYPLSILLFTIPGVPSLYYGSEWGIAGRKLAHSDAPLRPSITPESASASSPNRDLVHVIRSLIRIRREHPPIRSGSYSELLVSSEQLAFERRSEDSRVVTAVNAASEAAIIDLNVGGNDEIWRDALNDREIQARDGALQVHLHPRWGSILTPVRFEATLSG